MQLGMIGLGRMGADMVRRLTKAAHECVVYDVDAKSVSSLAQRGVLGTASLAQLVAALRPPRAIWLMVPAAVVDQELEKLVSLLAPGRYRYRWGKLLLPRRHTTWLGAKVARNPLHRCRNQRRRHGNRARLLPNDRRREFNRRTSQTDLRRTRSRCCHGFSKDGKERNKSTAEQGYLHCGPQGAGHFVKMVHNGIEYGVMAAYAEGLNIFRRANIGKQSQNADAETAPLRNPEFYQYDLNVPEIAEVWRHGSVISSWLLDLTAKALRGDAELKEYAGRVSDSGEGRWTLAAAIEEGVPAPVIGAALFGRFQSRGNADYADRLLSAMRKQFGGHDEKK